VTYISLCGIDRSQGKGDYCAVLLLRADDELAKADTDPAELRALLDSGMPKEPYINHKEPYITPKRDLLRH